MDCDTPQTKEPRINMKSAVRRTHLALIMAEFVSEGCLVQVLLTQKLTSDENERTLRDYDEK
jgi:hypothetical protein